MRLLSHYLLAWKICARNPRSTIAQLVRPPPPIQACILAQRQVSTRPRPRPRRPSCRRCWPRSSNSKIWHTKGIKFIYTCLFYWNIVVSYILFEFSRLKTVDMQSLVKPVNHHPKQQSQVSVNLPRAPTQPYHQNIEAVSPAPPSTSAITPPLILSRSPAPQNPENPGQADVKTVTPTVVPAAPIVTELLSDDDCTVVYNSIRMCVFKLPNRSFNRCFIRQMLVTQKDDRVIPVCRWMLGEPAWFLPEFFLSVYFLVFKSKRTSNKCSKGSGETSSLAHSTIESTSDGTSAALQYAKGSVSSCKEIGDENHHHRWCSNQRSAKRFSCSKYALVTSQWRFESEQEGECYWCENVFF